MQSAGGRAGPSARCFARLSNNPHGDVRIYFQSPDLEIEVGLQFDGYG